MKPILLILFFGLFLSLVGCKKDNSSPLPIASFSFRSQDVNELKIATYDTCTLVNNSTGGDTIQWDLGNGVISKDRQIVLSYQKSGTYTIKLTITNPDGKQSSVAKKVTVLDRVLKKIIIKSVYWDPKPHDIPYFNYVWPQTTTAAVYLQFRQYNPNDSIVPYSGLMPNSPILFTSSVIPGVPNQFNTPIEIPVTEKFILDKPRVQNRSLVMFLMAKDASGNVYNLMSNLESGSSWMIRTEDFSNNSLVIVCNLTSAVELDGDFE